MKISDKVIQKYLCHCPISSGKCDNFQDIRYKIERAVTLGTPVDLKSNGEKVVGYYHLNFVIKEDVVIDLYKGDPRRYVKIKEYMKRKYDELHSKVLV